MDAEVLVYILFHVKMTQYWKKSGFFSTQKSQLTTCGELANPPPVGHVTLV